MHIWAKGARKGTRCGCIVKIPTRSYCAKHLKQNDDRKDTPSNASRIVPDMNHAKNKSKVLRRNKSIDKLWHEETGMIFESVDDRRVTSRLVDGDIKDLTESDIETCKSMGFAIKQDVVQKQTDEDVVMNDVDSDSDIVSDTIGEVESLLNEMQCGDEMSDEETLEEEE
jgi:hypothetical protein